MNPAKSLFSILLPFAIALMATLSASNVLAQANKPSPATAAAGKKPNILVIFGDDIGMWNISAYSRGGMGYRTPNIDRIAKEGAIFTDLYAQQSCTAGRAAFITGQSCFRTGLLKVGLPAAKEGLSEKAAGTTFKVHLDGYDQHDVLAGTGPGKRKEFFYWTDDGNLAGLRYDRWKIVFLEQRARGLDVWQDPLIPLRLPKLFDIRADPFERADQDSGDYITWRVERAFVLMPAQAFVGQHLKTYVEYPPRQKPGSFSLDQVLEKLQDAGSSGKH
jgi:arylsulfatase A-like enzyme